MSCPEFDIIFGLIKVELGKWNTQTTLREKYKGFASYFLLDFLTFLKGWFIENIYFYGKPILEWKIPFVFFS